MLDIGDRVRKIREGKGVTQKVLAQSVGLSREFINRVESGQHSPNVEAVRKICDFLGVTLSEFFADDQTVLQPELRRLFEVAKTLNPDQRVALLTVAEAMMQKPDTELPDK